MLRGNYTATIDDKGRLKIPTYFRRAIEEKYNQTVFVTSLRGESVRIYPMSEWESIEGRLLVASSLETRKFLERTSYFGQPAEIDAQGRVLIHPLLRRKMGLIGEVAVLGYLTYLEVWDLETFEAKLLADPFTEADEAMLARLGV